VKGEPVSETSNNFQGLSPQQIRDLATAAEKELITANEKAVAELVVELKSLSRREETTLRKLAEAQKEADAVTKDIEIVYLVRRQIARDLLIAGVSPRSVAVATNLSTDKKNPDKLSDATLRNIKNAKDEVPSEEPGNIIEAAEFLADPQRP
jgi:hypothetical protein